VHKKTKELIVDEIITYGEMAADNGLIYGNFGNLSVKYEDMIYITKSGAMLGRLTSDDIVSFEDKIHGEASSDTPIHSELYKRNNCGAILHMHGDYTIIMSINHENVSPCDFVGMRFLEKIPVVEGEFGTSSLTNAIVRDIRNDAVIVKGHGSFTIGENLKKAYILSCAVETSCKILCFKEIHEKIITNITNKEVKK
jgi:L-fuculose-phosphate aldolase